jgi:hypothetical protein
LFPCFIWHTSRPTSKQLCVLISLSSDCSASFVINVSAVNYWIVIFFFQTNFIIYLSPHLLFTLKLLLPLSAVGNIKLSPHLSLTPAVSKTQPATEIRPMRPTI